MREPLRSRTGRGEVPAEPRAATLVQSPRLASPEASPRRQWRTRYCRQHPGEGQSVNRERQPGALQERTDGQGDQHPRVDRDEQRHQDPESRGVGGRRLVHRITIVTVCGAVITTLLAWAAILVYAAVWVVGLVA